LIGNVERAPESSTAERRRDGSASLRSRVALLAQMGQHDRQQSRVMEISQQLRCRAVRQVAG
jgi:hypothetical protein